MGSKPLQTHLVQAAGRELLVVALNMPEDRKTLSVDVKEVFAELTPFLKRARNLSITDPQTIAGEPLLSAFARELFRVTRNQQAADPTLGGSIATEGLAAFYATTKAAWRAPWLTGRLSQQVHDQARAGWEKRRFDRAKWFSGGPLGKWVGYRLGYQLVTEYLQPDGFELKKSLNLPASALKTLLK